MSAIVGPPAKSGLVATFIIAVYTYILRASRVARCSCRKHTRCPGQVAHELSGLGSSLRSTKKQASHIALGSRFCLETLDGFDHLICARADLQKQTSLFGKIEPHVASGALTPLFTEYPLYVVRPPGDLPPCKVRLLTDILLEYFGARQ